MPRKSPVPAGRTRSAALALALAFALAALPGAPAPLAAQDAEPPRVHVLATGGTISNTGGARLTGDELVESLPGIERFARITVEQFANVASGAITLDQWVAMGRRIDELFAGDDPPAGVVVTHGTDTMEETAWFLHLVNGACRPVIVTGAMRRATALGADGPANLFSAIRVAAASEAAPLGAAIVMNDDILPARDALKAHTSRPDAFIATGARGAGATGPDGVRLPPGVAGSPCPEPVVDPATLESLPRVEVIQTVLGADGTLIRAAADAGARGIIVASVGRGALTPGQRRAVQEVRARGVVVVVSSRTGSEGQIPIGPRGGSGAAMLGAGDLSPQKARILLMLALTRTDDPAELARIFATY